MNALRTILLYSYVSAFNLFNRVFVGKGLGKIRSLKAIYDFASGFLTLLLLPRVLKVDGIKLCRHPYVVSACRDISLGEYEPFTTEVFKKVVRKGDTVVDLGANMGYYTLLASRIVGQAGKVYAFEPEPKTYELFTKNIGINGYDNIATLKKAVSSKVGTARLFLLAEALRNYDGINSLYELNSCKHFIEVETTTLNEFFKDNRQAVNVIKMDIEGSEIDALLGMGQVIKRNRNLKMFLEFSLSAIKGGGHNPEELIDALRSYGFRIFAIKEKERRLKYINTFSELIEITEAGLGKSKDTTNLLLTRH